MTDPAGARGHASGPHTADVVIEAWGPTAAACYEEAAAAFVDIFVNAGHATGGDSRAFDIGPGRPEDLLVLLLEELLFDVETRGQIAVATRVEARGDHLIGTFTFLPVEVLEVMGPLPKGVSYHDLEFGEADRTWHCRATVDV